MDSLEDRMAEDRMVRLLLIVCAAAVCAIVQSWSISARAEPAADQADSPAQLIRPKGEQSHPAHPRLGPVDDRCKPLKEQLESALQRSAKDRRAFQARLAHNAGTRFCREGRADRGLAELQRGLSYLQAEAKP